MKFRAIPTVAAAVLSLTLASAAHAQRYVVVNNQRLSHEDIQLLERLNCGPVANGHYWYDGNSGLWGYAGNPYPQGRVGENCNRQSRRQSLSERGQLFSTWDWVRD